MTKPNKVNARGEQRALVMKESLSGFLPFSETSVCPCSFYLLCEARSVATSALDMIIHKAKILGTRRGKIPFCDSTV